MTTNLLSRGGRSLGGGPLPPPSLSIPLTIPITGACRYRPFTKQIATSLLPRVMFYRCLCSAYGSGFTVYEPFRLSGCINDGYILSKMPYKLNMFRRKSNSEGIGSRVELFTTTRCCSLDGTKKISRGQILYRSASSCSITRLQICQ
jgi:hypothetical protein